MSNFIYHVKSNIKFEVLKEEKDYYVVVKEDEPDIKLRLEKFAVNGKLFKFEKARKDKPASPQKEKRQEAKL